MTEVETAKMSERGQIIIPKDIRRYIRAREDTIFTIVPIDRETIIMKKLDKMKIIQELRSIRIRIKEKLSPQEISQEIEESRKE